MTDRTKICSATITPYLNSACKDTTKLSYLQILSNQPVYQIPDEESGELADQQQDHCPAGSGLVEAEGDGYDISDEGYPGCKCEPDSVAVYLGLLLLEGFGLDFKPFLYPFPFADPADPICCDAS